METFDAVALAREFHGRIDALPERRVPLVRPIRREIGGQDVHRWARSPDRWWRRRNHLACM